MLEFNVKNQNISRTDDFYVVADSQNYLTAEFTFSEEWTYPATAVFRYDEKHYNVLLENNRCIVPWEVIKAPFFTVSVFCGDRITANAVRISVEKSGYAEGEAPGAPTPDVYARLIELSEETKSIAQSVRSDADNGVFDGKDGYTPVKGMDYFTDAEINDIVVQVTENVSGQYGDVEAVLDGIIGIQNDLIGGENV